MKYNNWQSVCKFWLCVTFGWKHGSWVVNVLANWMHIRPLLCRQDRHSGNLQTTWLSQCSIQGCQVSYIGIEILVFFKCSRLLLLLFQMISFLKQFQIFYQTWLYNAQNGTFEMLIFSNISILWEWMPPPTIITTTFICIASYIRI